MVKRGGHNCCGIALRWAAGKGVCKERTAAHGKQGELLYLQCGHCYSTPHLGNAKLEANISRLLFFALHKCHTSSVLLTVGSPCQGTDR